MATRIPTRQATEPRGYLDFKAVQKVDSHRVTYIGALPVFGLIDQGFITPVASAGLAPEILEVESSDGPVQRKTNSAHVQAIVDYIVEQAEKDEPWAFNSIVLYSTKPLTFTKESIGIVSAGEARVTGALSVGEGLHRSLAWAVALGAAKVRGVKRPEMSDDARMRIEQATIPVVVIEEADLSRQKTDFHRLNQQKPLTATVLTLTDDTVLSTLTRHLIKDVPLFTDRIDINNASVGRRSDKLLSFAQLRFVVASYLLGERTRSAKAINENVAKRVARDGYDEVRAELRKVFREVALGIAGLVPLQKGTVPAGQAGDYVRNLREKTLLASNAAWRALFVALNRAEKEGIDAHTALQRLDGDAQDIWSRDADFFVGSLIDRETGKLLSNRESIDAATDLLAGAMGA